MLGKRVSMLGMNPKQLGITDRHDTSKEQI